jgi:hypothetical protein
MECSVECIEENEDTLVISRSNQQLIKLHNKLMANLFGPLDDFDLVMERARKAGVERMMITGGSLSESKEALKLAETDGKKLEHHVVIIKAKSHETLWIVYRTFIYDGWLPSNTM